jgi:transposase
LGRSKGGLTTKLHAAVDGLGNPIRLILTGGEKADCSQALALLDGFDYEYALMDKAYDSDEIIEKIEQDGAIAVIPPKKNRIIQRECDFSVYKERHKIECFFGFIKHYRRIFSRFDKYARNYMGFVSFVSTLIWLK